MINFSIFDDKSIVCGLSEKADGPMNPVRGRSPQDDRSHSPSARAASNGMNFLNQEREENRRKFLEIKGLKGKLVLSRLEHGNKVILVDKNNADSSFQGDGLVTKEKDILLGVTVADCFPVFFFDPVSQIIGIAHCGWRGVMKSIVPETVSAFKNNFQSKPENILLAIGPGLRFCHFVVQDDVIGQFAGYESFIEKKDNGYHIDLEKIIHYQAMINGVRVVEAAGICTFEKENFFSFRRDNKEQVDSMLAYIGLV